MNIIIIEYKLLFKYDVPFNIFLKRYFFTFKPFK